MKAIPGGRIATADSPDTVSSADAPDVTVQAQVLNVLKDIQSRRALALLLSSHDLAVVRFIADLVAVMKDGKIVEYDATLEMSDNPSHPYVCEWMAAIPRLAVSR